MTLRRQTLMLSSGALLLAGACFFGSGLYIVAKAWLAQVLVAHAWQRTVAGDDDARPWPWADTRPVARLQLPKYGRTVMVLNGASGRNLAFGPTHMSATPMPGMPGNSVIMGHRDTHFAVLEQVRPGDVVHVETAASTARFAVTETGVVHESAVGLLDDTADATLTLITCYPFGALDPGTEWRYVVRAKRR